MNKPPTSWLPNKATPEEIALIHRQLKFLASRCDGARTDDGVGFNREDYLRGHDLARLPELTEAQAVEARSMLRKYHRQLEEMGEQERLNNKTSLDQLSRSGEGTPGWTVVSPPISEPPPKDKNERTKQLLIRGYLLVESALVHVSHGGPTREDGEAWAREVRELLREELLKVEASVSREPLKELPKPPTFVERDEINDMISACEDSGDLTPWEEDFIASISDQWARTHRLSEKQRVTLERIYEEKGR